ncbi:hypothetical protein T440DRAFT_404657 [Plenodomus tracheiphilus IPT5]|uniref:Glycoside hydrolase family 18 protein n=1 Tax=Plenodomus tracheiphilus IPT5 TaxID=1408161 RepID=A0A6A7AUH5_9PLEO|nr:hypothetical protein T440DRAFT_404657 [Plenodomus tracheiphilus IPT5]
MMAPTCSRAALQLLTTVLLVSTIANAVAVPHQVLDPRTPAVQVDQLPAEVSAALRTAVGDDPDNVFQEVEDAFRSRTGLEVIRDFFARLFGWDEVSEDSTDEPTPSASETITPPGPPVTSDGSPDATATPSPSADISILPEGPMTTAINVTLPDPVFSLPPFLNSSLDPLPTAVPITDEFSAIPFPGTGLPSNSTATVSLQLTSLILVTATIRQPLGTGTGLSNATASFTEIPLFPNSTATFVVVPTGILGTGTGSPVAFTEIPLYPNVTSTLPTHILGTGTAAGTGAPVSFTEIPTYTNTTTVTTTITPLGTGVVGTGAVGTGTGSPVVFTEIPIFPNVTTLFSTTTTTLVGTGLPSLLPSSNGTALNDTPSAFPGLLALRRICQDPSIKVITLPLISRFYGPSGYPTLQAFPGCTVPNDRQAFQAPGLLNCSALGAEVQRCQSSGRKVLLSVKADGLEAVGGNADFGDPSVDPNPFGPVFADGGPVGATYDNVGVGSGDDDLEKRQVDINININFPSLGHGPYRPHRPTGSWFHYPHRPDHTDGPDHTDRPAPPPRPDESETPSRPHRPSFPDVPFPTLLPPGMASMSTISDDFPAFEATTPINVASASDSVTSTPSSEEFTTTSATIAPSSEAFVPSSATSVPGSASFTPNSANATSISATPIPLPSPISVSFPDPTPFPNLFNANHPPTAFALTLFSLFGEGHTERADLRPLGPDVGGPAAPSVFDGTNWVTPPTSVVPILERPLGEEVVVDGFDVQLPVEWKGKYQDTMFRNFVTRLRELNRDAWKQTGGIEGGPSDLGADGKAVVYFGWVGELLKRREAAVNKAGWIEWDGSS